MSSEVSHKKKRSFLGRLFSRTLKTNKKVNSTKNNTTLLESANFTYCDLCDKEIVSPNLTDPIICHEACQHKGLGNITLTDTVGTPDDYKTIHIKTRDKITNYNIFNNEEENSQLTTSDKHISSNSDITIDTYKSKRISLSLTNLAVPFNNSDKDDKSDAGDATLKPIKKLSVKPIKRRISHTRGMAKLNLDVYTFSTVDLNSIQKSGITMKRLKDDVRESQLFVDLQHYPMSPKIVDNRNSVAFMSNGPDLENIPPALQNIVDIFNNNDQGLWLEFKNNQLMGRLRIYINLIRPINMLLTARPPSIYDTLTPRDPNQSTIERKYCKTQSIFWLPRGTTKVLYMNVNSTTSDVINQLLNKFNISNNPKKFALYEHIISSKKELHFRKLKLSQCPLKIIIGWCEQGANKYQENISNIRFVLQENDPGNIDWEEFSFPELNSFLTILNNEENEKRQQIENKYSVLRSEIQRLMVVSSSL